MIALSGTFGRAEPQGPLALPKATRLRSPVAALPYRAPVAAPPSRSGAAEVPPGGAQPCRATRPDQVIACASRLLRLALEAPAMEAIATLAPPEVAAIDSVAPLAWSLTVR